MLIGTKIIHLESERHIKLFDQINWLRREMERNPAKTDTNKNKIRLINEEIRRRELGPMTNDQKRGTQWLGSSNYT